MKPYEPYIILGSFKLLNHVTQYFTMCFYSVFEFLHLLLVTFQVAYSCTYIILVYLLYLPSRFFHGISKHPIYMCLVCVHYSYMNFLVFGAFTKTDKHRFIPFIKNIHINHLKLLVIHFSLLHLLQIPLIKETRVINK